MLHKNIAEEAIINSMVAANDMTGHRGIPLMLLSHDKLIEYMREYKRLP